MSDIERKRGDSYADVFVLSSRETGQILNLSGYSTFLLTLDTRKDPPDTTTQVYQLAGQVVGPQADGKVQFAPTPAQADRIGRFFFDLQVTEPGGAIRTVLAARYTYRQDITKAGS